MKKLISVLFGLFLFQSTGFCAFPATAIFEFRTTGAATNGGGFNSARGGTDYSQQDADQYALTGLTSVGAGTTILTASAAAVMAGNFIYIASGTNFTVGWYEIVSVSVGVSLTVDRACTTGAGALGVGNIGGSLSTPRKGVYINLVPGNICYYKSGTFTAIETIDSVGDGNSTGNIWNIGYKTTRGDNPTGTDRPIWAMSTYGLWFGKYWRFKNLSVTSTNSQALRFNQDSIAENCKVYNSSASAGGYAFFAENESIRIINCEAICTNGVGIGNDGGGGKTGGHVIQGCYIHDSANGINNNGGYNEGSILNCVFANITGTALKKALREPVIGCTFYGGSSPQGVGLDVQSDAVCVMNNIFVNWTTGITMPSGAATSAFIDYNNFYGNTTARTNVSAGDHDTAINPAFVNAGAGNFALGASIPGFPGIFPAATTTGYLSMGAVQPAAGGGATEHSATFAS